MNLEILEANLKGTNWSNAKEEDGKIFANYYGELKYPRGNGLISVYSGDTLCQIFPSKNILEKAHDFGFDQKGFISQEMDWVPVGEKNNF